MDRLLVVDGSNLLFQMFYGMPARITGPQGRPVQGTLGFLGALLKSIRMTQATHVAVLFDGECTNERRELDEEYKANRPDFSEMPEEDTPFSQLPDIYKALDHLGIRHRETDDCEADDWIAGYARRYGGNTDVVILSQDSDFYQLITDRVRVLRYRGKQSAILGPEEIFQKLGVQPERYAAYKSLTGDQADNIRGAEKIGPKTAAALMAQFGDLETMIQNADKISKPSIRESVIRHAQRIRINYFLICLKGAEELPFSPEELAFQDPGGTSVQVLKSLGIL